MTYIRVDMKIKGIHVRHFSQGLANSKFLINGTECGYITPAGGTESKVETRDSWKFTFLPFSTK